MTWQTKPLSACIEKVPKANKIQAKNFLEAGKYPVVSQEAAQINGFWNNEEDLMRINHPVVVFGDHTQVLKYIDFNFVVGADGVKVLSPKSFILPKYFYYFLQSKKIKKLGYARHYRILKEINISYPESLPEQKRIVSILDKAFAAIEKAKENAEKNLQNANELFESYLHSMFQDKNWDEDAFGKVCTFVRGPFGGSLKKSIFKSDGFAVYEQQHAIYDQFTKIRYFINKEKFNEMKRFEVKSGDLIMSCSGTMGKVAIVPQDVKVGIINQALLKISPSSKIINSFLKYWMESGDFQSKIREQSQGAAIKNVASVKILKEISIPLPSIAEQITIVSKLSDAKSHRQQLDSIYTQKLSALDELKQSLLHKAFNGEL